MRRAELAEYFLCRPRNLTAVIAAAMKGLFLTSHAANQSSLLPSLSLAECLNFLRLLLPLTSSAP